MASLSPELFLQKGAKSNQYGHISAVPDDRHLFSLLIIVLKHEANTPAIKLRRPSCMYMYLPYKVPANAGPSTFTLDVQIQTTTTERSGMSTLLISTGRQALR